MFLEILIFLVGIVMLIMGANVMVDSASTLAQKFKIPNIVIGLTIVSMGAAMPELIVSLMASSKKNSDIVFGSIVGSNIFNILVVLGITAIILPLAVKRKTTWIEIPLSLLSAVAILIMANPMIIDGANKNVVTRTDGLIMIMFFCVFITYIIGLALEGKHEEEVPTKNYSKTVCGILIVVGIGLLSLGGDLMLESSTKIAEGFGISERIIALTIISAGISLPELAISIIAAKKGNVDIAVGNVVGSNIFKSFFILGASVLINPAVASKGMNIDLWLNVFASSILFIFIFTGGGRKIHKWEGISMVLIYAAYVGYLILHP